MLLDLNVRVVQLDGGSVSPLLFKGRPKRWEEKAATDGVVVVAAAVGTGWSFFPKPRGLAARREGSLPVQQARIARLPAAVGGPLLKFRSTKVPCRRGIMVVDGRLTMLDAAGVRHLSFAMRGVSSGAWCVFPGLVGAAVVLVVHLLQKSELARTRACRHPRRVSKSQCVS